MITPNSAHPALAVGGGVVHSLLAIGCMLTWLCTRRSGWISASWLWMAVVQAFFAVDSIVGIRLIIAEAGREYFTHHGWYDERRPMQMVLTLAAIIAVLMIIRFISLAQGTSATHRMAVVGTGIVLALFLNSAISLHQTGDFSLSLAGRVLGCGLTGVGLGLGIRNACLSDKLKL